MVLSEKYRDSEPSTSDTIFDSGYLKFRLENGDTLEEIKLKTERLKSVMIPHSQKTIDEILMNNGFNVQDSILISSVYGFTQRIIQFG